MSAVPPEDAFLEGFIGTRALSFALSTGLIDRLADGPASVEALASAAQVDPAGLSLLADLLAGAGVLTREGRALALTPRFRAALPRRAAMEAKLAFLDLAARDVEDHFAALLFDPKAYVGAGRVFSLFRYDRAVEPTAANLAHTRRWVDYVSALTEHEAEVVAPHLDLSARKRLLDVGGNSGAFAAALCRHNPALEATVLDLPVVCRIGSERMAGRPEAARIRFQAGDARHDPWPEGYDVISFKSVLHDWPEADALDLLARAADTLPSGGLLAVFERGPFEGTRPQPFSAVANLVFAPFYRAPEIYLAALERLGFAGIAVRPIEIEMTFHLITAVKR